MFNELKPFPYIYVRHVYAPQSQWPDFVGPPPTTAGHRFEAHDKNLIGYYGEYVLFTHPDDK